VDLSIFFSGQLSSWLTFILVKLFTYPSYELFTYTRYGVQSLWKCTRSRPGGYLAYLSLVIHQYDNTDQTSCKHQIPAELWTIVVIHSRDHEGVGIAHDPKISLNFNDGAGPTSLEIDLKCFQKSLRIKKSYLLLTGWCLQTSIMAKANTVSLWEVPLAYAVPYVYYILQGLASILLCLIHLCYSS